ncbi:hypothetical protein [Elizabethkingia anophelis]|uniref:hypothetical protein n=1 Tax=Elizabethkingia anophelis TaxID=1117645 RepID=UPI00063AE2F4|nr:hypothetical protein [Elizabethkingia anophelis]AKH96249.1 hypothetical protein M876_16990 [Elizabethkingia anophelis FMS-007]
MVTITNYKTRKKEDGTKFYVLELQSGIELIQSKTTGHYYATTKKCYIPATFDESVCKSLRGTEMSGSIQKVECEPYDYTIQDTGELVILNYRYEYKSDEATEEYLLTESSNCETILN